jgi:hypothetical protein
VKVKKEVSLDEIFEELDVIKNKSIYKNHKYEKL